MSAIGREGGHSRGRTRQGQPGDGNGNDNAGTGVQTDTERSNYIGQASDRGNSGAPGSGGNGRGDRSVNELSRSETPASGGRNF